MDAVSEMPPATLADLGNDLMDEGLAYEQTLWPEGDGNPATPDLWKVKKNQLTGRR